MGLSIKNQLSEKSLFKHSTKTGEGFSTEKIIKKEIFLTSVNPTPSTTNGKFAMTTLTDTESCNFAWKVPYDFNHIELVRVIIYPDTTETISYDIWIGAGLITETTGDKDRGQINQTKAVTINKIDFLNIITLFDNIAEAIFLKPNEYIGIHFLSNTANIRVVGLEIIYY